MTQTSHILRDAQGRGLVEEQGYAVGRSSSRVHFIMLKAELGRKGRDWAIGAQCTSKEVMNARRAMIAGT
jgi:hypothetical protein